MTLDQMRGRVRTLTWYLKRPALWPQLVRDVRKRAPGPDDSAAAAIRARRWCNDRAVTTRAAVRELTGNGMGLPIRERFPDVFRAADRIAAACPIRMGGAGDLDLLFSLADWSKARRIVETGVAYGWSSLAILLSLADRDGGRLWSTDMPYRRHDNDHYVGCVVSPGLRDCWEIVRQADREALPKVLRKAGTIDMCHYDSDKTYKGRMWAYPRMWHALRPGGFFLSDDVGDNAAFRDFAAAVGREPVVVRIRAAEGHKFVGILVKPPVLAVP